MRNHSWMLLLSVAVAFGALAGCSDDPSGPSYGTMTVRMTDAPGAFESVNLVVTEVSAHLAEGEDDDSDADSTESGWIVLNGTPGTYDLIDLQNGVFVTLGTAKVPAGHYTQVRLKLGAGSTVTVDGVTHPLNVPSGMQSGLKLVGNFEVPANGLLDLGLDFDAARSVVLNGAGEHHLKPTVKIMPFSTAGSITGLVAPAGTATTVYAVQEPDTLGSTSANIDGRFTLALLAPGLYTLEFDAADAFRDTTLSGISVSTGGSTDIGTVQLTAHP